MTGRKSLDITVPDKLTGKNLAGSYGLTMGSPARYRIRVRGNLDDSWSEKLGDLQIMTHLGAGVTVITGALSDQAALSGILNTLYNQQFPIISVEHLPHS